MNNKYTDIETALKSSKTTAIICRCVAVFYCLIIAGGIAFHFLYQFID
jgi:hypothetical protein